jgi:hypothetical protein
MLFGKPFKIILLISLTALFIDCENQTEPQLKTDLSSESMQGTVWLAVDKNDKPKIEDFQKCTLIFLNDNRYEIKRTFVYSRSSFRNPGIYEVKDSVIMLKSLNGRKVLGNLYMRDEDQLFLEWKKAALFGEGKGRFIEKNN